MTKMELTPGSLRVAEAKLARRGGKTLATITGGLLITLTTTTVILLVLRQPWCTCIAGIVLLTLVTWLWLKRRILVLEPARLDSTNRLEELMPPELAAGYQPTMTTAQFWQLLAGTWQARFILLRFGLHPDDVATALNDLILDHTKLWATAVVRAQAGTSDHLNAGAIIATLAQLSAGFSRLLTAAKLELTDLDEGTAWLTRLEAFSHDERPDYGGIARDWAAGFTPTLSHFGQNLSRQIELAGPRFGVTERTNQLDALVTALSNANGSVVIVGEPGIGKTALLYGLADRLLQGKESGALARHQIFSLNAALILGQQDHAGDIERIVLQLLNEAVHAGNIVVALDEAQLFFGQGTGAVNLSQILLPVLQARSLKLVLGVTPGDWQKLKAVNSAMASLLTPLVLTEPSQIDTVRLLGDRALVMEGGRFTTTYQALVEAYRLSGRYLQEEAYPGRALKLLEAALNFPEGPFITTTSVQRAVESQLGVKVQSATADESDALLHLEDRIHERMINQSRAVNVVAAALRRARAGVANPKRPVGSFLFLGPTGVGKTELTRSLAAVYFGSERNMIRLDMSEYQQVSDVSRLLASAAQNPEALLPKVRQQPFSVILFDEVEKAHPNILNLLLQLLDEGQLTDVNNKAASFKDAIVIATSNAGADEIRRRIESGEELESFEQQFTDNLINKGAFKPELINRFDEVVLFRPLNQAELAQVVELLVAEVNRTLAPQKIRVELASDAVTELVTAGYDPRLGARPMRRMVQRRVEDAVAGQILRGQAKAGDTITLKVTDVGGSLTAPERLASATQPTKSNVLYERPKPDATTEPPRN